MNLPSNRREVVTWNNTVSEEVRRRLRATAFPAGSLIFPKIGAAIATNKKRILTCPSCVDNNVMALVPDESQLDPTYLYYLLLGKDLRDFASDSNPPSIRKTTVEAWRICVPTLEYQREISDVLARAEGIVRLRREALAKAQLILPALFLHMFGDPAENPRGWQTAFLGDLLALPIRNGVSPSRSGQHKGRVLTLSAITGGTFKEAAVKEAMFAAPLSGSDEVSSQDFLICRGNGNKSLVGVGCFPLRDMRGVAFPDTAMAVRPRTGVLASKFLSAQWKSQWVRQQVEAIARTTNGTYKINQTGLAGIKLIIPPQKDQQEFEARALAMESILEQQAASLNMAEAAFQALLSRAFNGVPKHTEILQEASIA